MATAAATNLSPNNPGQPAGAAPLGVPWPWVDPARRQVLPKALYQQRREALPLAQALDELQVRQGGGVRGVTGGGTGSFPCCCLSPLCSGPEPAQAKLPLCILHCAYLAFNYPCISSLLTAQTSSRQGLPTRAPTSRHVAHPCRVP